MNQKRTPAGIPTGGEFAANEHDEAGSPLAPSSVPFTDEQIDNAVKTRADHLLEEKEEALNDRLFEEQDIDPVVFPGNRIDPPEYLEVDWDVSPSYHEHVRSAVMSFADDNSAVTDRLFASGYPFTSDRQEGAHVFVQNLSEVLDEESDRSARKVFDRRVPDDIVLEIERAAGGSRRSFEFDYEVGKGSRWSMNATAIPKE